MSGERRAGARATPRPVLKGAVLKGAVLKGAAPLRVAFVAPRFHTNQVGLVRALLAHGHPVRFFTLYRGGSEEHRDLSPSPVPLAGLSTWLARRLGREHDKDFLMRYAFPTPWRLTRALREFGADVYVIRDPNYLFAFAALLVACGLGRRVVVYTQGPKYAGASRGARLKRLAVGALGHAWITPVLGERREGALTHDKIHYFPFVIDAPAPPERGVPEVIRLLAVGKFEPRKHHLMLVEVFARLAGSRPCHLTLVGECTTPAHAEYFGRVERRVRDLGLAGRVTLRRNESYADMRRLYRDHDLFVLPSEAEPAAVSPLEAMAQGLAVVCSDGNGTRCYVEEGVSGSVFRSGDPDDLERVLRELTADPRRLLDLGRAGYRLAASRHHPERAYRELLALLGRPRGARLAGAS